MRLVSPFVDLRLKKTGEVFFNRMIERKTVRMRRLANGRTEAVKFERWLRNKNVTAGGLIHTEQMRVNETVKDRHVLIVQDTSEINYQKKSGRVHGLGTVGNGTDVGFFIHPALVIDADTGGCLGAATVHLENRLKKASDDYQKLPIEDKESYRWISTAEMSKKALTQAKCVTFIGDRENDIYEFIDRVPDKNTHIITRARHNRELLNGDKLNSHLDAQEASGKIRIIIPRDGRKKRKKRETDLSIKYSEVEIIKPKKCTDKNASEKIRITVVEAVEINCPAGQKPVHWRLLTTHKVEDFENAHQIVLWYRARWNVEQIFRTMKKQGMDVESSQVESAENLMKLAVIALCASIRIMQLVLARSGTTKTKNQ